MKNIFKFLYGSDNNLTFKISSTTFITSIIAIILSIVYKDNSLLSNLFLNISGAGFAIFLLLLNGFDSFFKFVQELSRFIIFLPMFICSIFYLLHISSINILAIILCLILTFISCFYFVSKLNDFFDLTKLLFKKIKYKIFNTENVTSTGFKAVLENITVFLVSIGGFLIAIRIIIQVIIQIVTLKFN